MEERLQYNIKEEDLNSTNYEGGREIFLNRKLDTELKPAVSIFENNVMTFISSKVSLEEINRMMSCKHFISQLNYLIQREISLVECLFIWKLCRTKYFTLIIFRKSADPLLSETFLIESLSL